MMTLKELVNSINASDDAIKDLQDSKSETYTAFREQYIAQGHSKAEAKLRLEAIKAAIRRLRALENDEAAVLEKDDIVEAVILEIKSGTNPATRAHVARDAA